MKSEHHIEVSKSSGNRAKFSIRKLRNSLLHSGADKASVDEIVNEVRDQLYHGIPTKEIYNYAFEALRKKKSIYASRYKLKKAIYELGPSGLPFETLVYFLLKEDDDETTQRVILQGKCITHEIDLLIQKEGLLKAYECKFHSEEGRTSGVKIPMYIDSRFRDLKYTLDQSQVLKFTIVTNTRFTEDAMVYAKCAGLEMLSWNYPEGIGIKELLDKKKLYPITASTLLTAAEKEKFLKKDIILMRQWLENEKIFSEMGISKTRSQKLMQEASLLCMNDE